jgi:tRNA(adenine34) deaminase
MNLLYMEEALKEAEKAFDKGEVPIGAVIVMDGTIIGRGHNQKESLKDPTAHAEILAIRAGSSNIGGWRLEDSELYVTVEPCIMCAGAIYQSRIKKVYIGAKDYKGGAICSLYNVFDDARLNHKVEYQFGLMEEQCSSIMKKFFKKLRAKD